MKSWQEMTTEERVEIITPLWTAGQSAQQIADQIEGATRNAVIGRIGRSKLPKRDKDNVRSPRRMKSLKRAALPKPPKPPKQPAEKPEPKPEPESEETSILYMIHNNRQPLAGTVPVGIMDLPSRTGVLCRFPVVGGYCGAACGDKMYCHAHHAVMYREAEKFRMPREARL